MDRIISPSHQEREQEPQKSKLMSWATLLCSITGICLFYGSKEKKIDKHKLGFISREKKEGGSFIEHYSGKVDSTLMDDKYRSLYTGLQSFEFRVETGEQIFTYHTCGRHTRKDGKTLLKLYDKKKKRASSGLYIKQITEHAITTHNPYRYTTIRYYAGASNPMQIKQIKKYHDHPTIETETCYHPNPAHIDYILHYKSQTERTEDTYTLIYFNLFRKEMTQLHRYHQDGQFYILQYGKEEDAPPIKTAYTNKEEWDKAFNALLKVKVSKGWIW